MSKVPFVMFTLHTDSPEVPLDSVMTTAKFREAATTSPHPAKHQAVVKIVQRILAGKNGVRH